jgi:DNA-binding GntR family transcriptional regulator
LSRHRNATSSGAAASTDGDLQRRHSTVTEFIVENLRSDILTGRLGAAAPLLLDQLAERFGTSVIPVREALRALEAERLVVLRPHRTAQVADLSVVELKDLYRVRLLLDVEAVRWAHGNISAADIAELRHMIDAMERSAKRGDFLNAFSIHTQIHLRIYEAAGSRVLLAILGNLWDETERYRHAVKLVRSDIPSWADEHRRLIDLLETGSADAAAKEMKSQIERTLEALLAARIFEERPPAAPVPQGQRRRLAPQA